MWKHQKGYILIKASDYFGHYFELVSANLQLSNVCLKSWGTEV